ncbi:CobW family GTP-binding protein [Brevibacterium yomogidense]|uniref:Putative metal chaperone, involved in Zn homeostasis, GTPase of COG0523 family n=1 Tax=Brevibacterium yomogidense TaxID=946573 RepID=A0A1X6XNW8_9MICO|nr:GTP-binding protein [Brevibacterium yomogidense]SLN00843.1 Putative metal chaperone, involved in Zn homeostasis, GTPase of COG0523 family [Brevibacterium yomogidense]
MSTRTKPLTLMSGYLGSGKTTLINHVLGSGALGRAAVVVNDFGDVNIDAALIRSSGADTIELTNGCICCQITDDVQRTMGALAARDDLDHVVCEVSGIGDPAQLGAWRTYPGFRPGGIVVCVDAGVTVRRLRDEYVADIVRAQIAAADLLVVTKADAAGDLGISLTVEACKAIAGEVPVQVVRGEDWTATLRALESVARETGRPADSHPDSPSDPSSEHSAVHSTLTVDMTGPIDVEGVVEVLRSHEPNLVRAKGIVQDSAGAWVTVQLAGGLVTVEPAGAAPGSSAPGSVAPGESVSSGSVPGPSGSAPGPSAIVLIAAGPDADEALERAAQELAGRSPQ